MISQFPHSVLPAHALTEVGVLGTVGFEAGCSPPRVAPPLLCDLGVYRPGGVGALSSPALLLPWLGERDAEAGHPGEGAGAEVGGGS